MDLTPRQTLILRSFYNRQRTVREVAEELGIHYETLVKDVKVLVDSEHLAVHPYREGKKRLLTTAKFPETIMDLPNEQVMINWRGKLLSLGAAVTTVAPNLEASIKLKITHLLSALQVRGQLLTDGEEGGWTAMNIKQATQRLLSEIQEWELFITELLKLPIWTDSPSLVEKIGFNTAEENTRQMQKVAHRIQIHHMASGRRMLDAYEDKN